MIKLNKKLKLTTENKDLSIFPNYLFGIVLTSKLEEPLGINYPPMFCEYYNNSNRWANDIDAANENAKLVLDRIIKDEGFVGKVIENYNKYEKETKKLCKWIEEADLKKLSKIKIREEFEKLVNLYVNILVYGWLPLASEGFESEFTNLLKNFLKNKLEDLEKVNDYFIVLSTPNEKTLREKAEEDIKRFINKNKEEEWIKDIRKESLGEMNKNIKRFTKNYIEKYKWLTFNYEGPSIDWIYVIERLKENLKAKKYNINIRGKQVLYGNFLKLNKDKLYSRLFKTIRDFMFLKNRQDEIQFYSHYCLEKLFLEISNRFGLDIKIIRSMTIEEIKSLLNENKINIESIKKRAKHCVYVFNREEFEIIIGECTIKKFLEKHIEKERIVNELKGQPACMGYAEGRVKIVQSVNDMGKMEEGDILVSSKTYPSLLPAMRKAAAIVTDQGGITSHAAILSRELNIPCIVGTKSATKILKDGDLIKVDAKKGIVNR